MNYESRAGTENRQHITEETRKKQLVNDYESLVFYIAKQVSLGIPPNLKKELMPDLIQAGKLGLLEADNNYNPYKGTQFKTFAFYRIKGAMLDCLRKSHPNYVSKAVRDKYYNGPMPAEAEAQEVKNGKGHKLGHAMVTGRLQSLASLTFKDMALAETGSLWPVEPQTPEAILNRQQGFLILKKAVARLKGPYKQLIEGYYFHNGKEVTMEEVARKMGYSSKSWVSQLHKKALQELRSILEANSKDNANAGK